MFRAAANNAAPIITPGLRSFALASEYYLANSFSQGGPGTGTPSTGAKAYFTYFAPSQDAVVSGMALYLATGQTGAKALLGIYSNVLGKPSALLADFGEVDLSGGAGMVEATSTTLQLSRSAGGYWCCVWMKNVATQASVSGALSSYNLPMTASDISTAKNFRGYSSVTAYPAGLPAAAPTSTTDNTGTFGFAQSYLKFQ